MLGSAMFTTVRSRTIMSWAQSTSASVRPRRSVRRAGGGLKGRTCGAMVDTGTGFLPGMMPRRQLARLAEPIGGQLDVSELLLIRRIPPVTIRRLPPFCKSDGGKHERERACDPAARGRTQELRALAHSGGRGVRGARCRRRLPRRDRQARGGWDRNALPALPDPPGAARGGLPRPGGGAEGTR